MARIYSFKERATTFRSFQSILKDMVDMNRGIERYRDDLMSPDIEDGYDNIHTAITGMLNKFADMGDKLRTLLADFDESTDDGYTYECLVRPYINSAFVKWTIDVSNGSSRGVITGANEAGSAVGAPFAGYQSGDTVRLANFNNPDGSGVTADGDYEVYSVDASDQVLTLTTALTGVDSSDDRYGYIRIVER